MLSEGHQLVPGFEDLDHDEKMGRLGLPSIVSSRNMIETYKYAIVIYVAADLHFLLDMSVARGHSFKLIKKYDVIPHFV